MLMQLLACAALTGGCAYLGQLLSRSYRQKVLFWEELQSFCRELRGDIGFLQTKLPDFFKRHQNRSSAFAEFLGEMQKACEKGEEFSISNASARNVISFFSEEDAALLFAFFGGLGKSDRESQLNSILSFEKVLDEKIAESKREYGKSGVLYQKLSIFLGLLLSVLLM